MALRVIATSLAEWAVLRFAVGYVLAALVYSAFGGKPMWVAAYNALAFAAYLTYAALGRGVARNPFVWGAIRPVSVAMGVAALAVFLFARGPHLAEVPGRISEVLAFSTHPGAVTMYLLAPMKEELLYRGILLRRLAAAWGCGPGSWSRVSSLGYSIPILFRARLWAFGWDGSTRRGLEVICYSQLWLTPHSI